ncbi:hypothetical protein HX868_14075 [Pseudomonas reactans]|nr:hypothetical protein [Pseudomonas reactans]
MGITFVLLLGDQVFLILGNRRDNLSPCDLGQGIEQYTGLGQRVDQRAVFSNELAAHYTHVAWRIISGCQVQVATFKLTIDQTVDLTCYLFAQVVVDNIAHFYKPVTGKLMAQCKYA